MVQAKSLTSACAIMVGLLPRAELPSGTCQNCLLRQDGGFKVLGQYDEQSGGEPGRLCLACSLLAMWLAVQWVVGERERERERERTQSVPVALALQIAQPGFESRAPRHIHPITSTCVHRAQGTWPKGLGCGCRRCPTNKTGAYGIAQSTTYSTVEQRRMLLAAFKCSVPYRAAFSSGKRVHIDGLEVSLGDQPAVTVTSILLTLCDLSNLLLIDAASGSSPPMS
ncbi:hypothetical protein BX600DRAFT_35157 [Xylariales sp. PMI_506]|nr:hypothetical protein BX600DRAFT_35157 [Xylariales sp. PMI_506]